MSHVLGPRSSQLAPGGRGLSELCAKTTRKSAISIRTFDEIRAPQWLVHQPIQYPCLYGRANRLDQVECEAVAIRRIFVQKAKTGIEAARRCRQSAFAFGDSV